MEVVLTLDVALDLGLIVPLLVLLFLHILLSELMLALLTKGSTATKSSYWTGLNCM